MNEYQYRRTLSFKFAYYKKAVGTGTCFILDHFMDMAVKGYGWAAA